MNTMELVHFVSTGERPTRRETIPSPPPFYTELIRPTRQAILCARQYLLDEQHSDGSWHAMRFGNASLASQFLLLLAYLGEERSRLAERLATTIFAQQLSSGGWALAPGGALDLSSSVQAYFALKLTVLDAGDERLSRAREAIRQHGGADAADSATHFLLALLGQILYDDCPAVRPESLLLGGQRTRSAAPLAAIWAHRPLRRIDAERGVRELFVKNPDEWSTRAGGPWLRRRFSTFLMSMGRRCERNGWTPFRRHALNRIESQLLEHTRPDRIRQCDFLQLVWHAIAIHAVGYPRDSHALSVCLERLQEMILVNHDSEDAHPGLREAPVSDTVAVLESLGASGMVEQHGAISAAAGWLAQTRRPDGEPVGVVEAAGMLELLSMESRSTQACEKALPPGIDLTRRLTRNGRFNGRMIGRVAQVRRVRRSLIARLLKQQNADGGWSPRLGGGKSAPDVTGAVLESLARQRDRSVSWAADRAIAYLRRTQRPDGSWDSATGVRLIHGTSLAVRGLLAAGVPCDGAVVAGGLNWLLVHQQPSGGWGETDWCLATDVRGKDFVSGPATASQTAWAILALVSAGKSHASAVRRGVDFLLQTQQDDGRWHEPQFVLRDPGAGRLFRSDLHAVVSPLRALSRWAVTATETQSEPGNEISLRLVTAEM